MYMYSIVLENTCGNNLDNSITKNKAIHKFYSKSGCYEKERVKNTRFLAEKNFGVNHV